MLSKLKDILLGNREAQEPADPRERLIIATCVLFVEMANIDGEFTEDERQLILGLLRDRYQLDPDMAQEILAAAEAEVQGSIDYWQFTGLINRSFSESEKIEVVEMLWRLVFVDGHLDAHEEYLTRKIADLLTVSHSDFIKAKTRALLAEDD